MNPLILPDLSSLAKLEDMMHRVVESEGAPLQLNKDFTNRRKGAMHDAARLQLLVTWARLAKDRQLHFHNANLAKSVLEELCDYAPGIAALRLSDGVVIGDQVISRRSALEFASEKMGNSDKMSWSRFIKGRTLDFICVSGSKVQYLRPLFTARNKHSVKRKESMFLVLNELSEFVAQADAERIPQSFLKACAVFTSELLKNTQEHATSNHQNQPYLEHTEGLIISWQAMDEESYKEDFEGHPLLQEFWQRELVSVRGGQGKALRCLQLSFFDTGPGFVSRATGKQVDTLPLHEERNALLSTLQKNASTKREAGSGNGLPDVLEELKLIGGLIRIRSGRLSLFNAFTPTNKRGVFDFEDWPSKPLAAAAGAVVSLLIPIRR
ncbi:hypothetical protein ALFP_1429 [Alcaligenes faecalis]|uniref:hypothetical protein n=3 Tax=Alcaligenes faecalis TaxID=511 RepID=UPI0007C45E8A|nr:hypothetical protein [Alcaligenes faecalis]ARP53316.1 hypothetical protein ALFP_1429 [Alcaligenes faecalis]